MNTIKSVALAAATLTVLSFASSAFAATVVSGDVCEGGVKPANSSPCPTSQNLGDFNSDPNNPTLVLSGDTHIWGGVAHREKGKYKDNWAVDFGTSTFAGVFNWQAVTTNFDGELTVGGTTYSFSTADLGTPTGGSIDLGPLSGQMIFILDATAGNFSHDPDEVATWDMQLSQVPLPAGLPLMLAGMGGLALLRRRK